MDDLSVLKSQRNECCQELSKINTSIQKYERTLEALKRFKQDVEISEQHFESVNTTKISLVNGLGELTKNCLSAEMYLEGTDKTLNGFGSKIVGVAFDGLKLAIALKCVSYNAKILALDTQSRTVNARMNTIDTAIKTAQEITDVFEY